MALKIQLILPPSNFIEQAYGVKQKISFGHAPPLGVGYIAAYLEQDHHDVSILDASSMELSINETVDQIESLAPDVVGLSVLTNYADSTRELARVIKERLPETIILLGGAHAMYFYKEILSDMPGVDHVLYGEVDTVVRDYFRYLKQPEKLKQLKGLVYRTEDGEIVINEPPDIVEDLDNIPMPAWHLYDISLYRPLPLQYKQMPFFTLITSRSCFWRKCKFCFQAGHGSTRFRRHSPERVIREIEILHRDYGIREVNFWDDTFIVNKKWLKTFTDLLKKKNFSLTWTASGRVNNMDQEMIQMVYDAGCWSMFVGIESGNQHLLDSIQKGITLEQAETALKAANIVGIETRAAFILGLPGETPETARKTIDFALKLDPTYAIFYAAHPRYGTELYDIAQTSGTLLSKDFKGMSAITYVPEGYKSPEELNSMLKYAYRRYYLRPRFVYKMLKKMRTIRDVAELIKGTFLFLGLSRFGK